MCESLSERCKNSGHSKCACQKEFANILLILLHMGMEMIDPSIKFHCETKLNLIDIKSTKTTIEMVLANHIFTVSSIKIVGNNISLLVHNGTGGENQGGFYRRFKPQTDSGQSKDLQ